MTTQTGWTVQVTGTVTQVYRMDVDKSGRHPRFMVRLHLEVEAVDDAGAGLELNARLSVQGKETEITQQLGRAPQVGDRVMVRSSGTEKQPKQLSIDGIQFAA
ncbi:hypothetical protein TFLX_03006 [Thermoflexales bacterium]|nr:hypothetical protein TFLX_03006 [Thermoflexales bacterium]